MNVTFKTNNARDLAILVQLAKRLNIEIEQTSDIKDELQVNELTDLSFNSFEKVWNKKEDDIWEDFFKETQIESK